MTMLYDHPFALVVSTGRTGTQFFAYLLERLAPDYLAVHEPHPDAFILATQRIREGFSDAQVLDRYMKMRTPLLAPLDAGAKQGYVESNNNLVPLLSCLLSRFNQLNVLHVVREPLSYVASAINNVQRTAYTLHGDSDPRARINADDFQQDPYCGHWRTLTQVEKLAWHWQAYNKMIVEQAASHRGYLCLSFEALFANHDPQPMQQALRFLTQRDFSLDAIGQVLQNKQNHRDRAGQPAQKYRLSSKECDAVHEVILRCKAVRYL